jgi:hypothetical protein
MYYYACNYGWSNILSCVCYRIESHKIDKDNKHSYYKYTPYDILPIIGNQCEQYIDIQVKLFDSNLFEITKSKSQSQNKRRKRNRE